jgi:chitin disaccharide deacetylase
VLRFLKILSKLKMLIVNADDYGLDKETSERILTCYTRKRIHSASAMTFMADSERAALLAKATGLSVGLHLNLDQEMTGPQMPVKLRECLRATASYLNAKKWNQLIFNPFLRTTFDYVFQAQWDEFSRLYGEEPNRLDGHHHWHLCMNILLSGKIPSKIKIRRNFTFYSGEKNFINRIYRYLLDWWLQSNFLCTDSFFSINPIDLAKLQRLVALSKSSDIEVMVHPGIENESTFLLSPEWENLISQVNKG